MKLYPEEDTAPLVDVDTFWHYHILDTMKYARDCEQAFGYFLHHYPYVGMRGGDDEQFRLDSGERMRELYEATFGEDYPGAQADAAALPVSGDASGSGTAWCAGPRVEAASGNGTAWCAGPRVEARAKRAEGAISAGTAWCAGPRLEVRAKGTQAATGVATAWCAGPRVEVKVRSEEGAVSAATAWCAGPRAGGAISAATAWCAGPRGAARAA
jgi:hypothetical protein